MKEKGGTDVEVCRVFSLLFRAVISGQNIQIIFTDVMNIFKVSRSEQHRIIASVHARPNRLGLCVALPAASGCTG